MPARLLATTLFAAGLAVANLSAQFCWSKNYVDLVYPGNGKPGWVQAGDMDLDGDLDLVAGGGTALVIYENDGSARGWARYGNLDSTRQIGANGGALLDVDGDGDLDVVAARYRIDIGWWENPGGPLAATPWAFHQLGDGVSGWYAHDVLLADLDEDGVAEEIVVNLIQGSSLQIKWYRRDPRPGALWPSHTIQSSRTELNNCHSGFGLGDIDRDGNVDLSYSEGWYRAPADPASGAWTWYRVESNIYGVSNSQVVDIDRDGRLDLVISAGHHGTGVYWLRAPVDPTSGSWNRHTIDSVVWHPEGLQVHDFDGDGDVDVLASELFFGEQPGEPGWNEELHNLYVYENLGGAVPQWRKVNIAPDSYPSHLPYLVDINRDGRVDIISESAGHSVISYYEALMPAFELRGVGLPGATGTAPTIDGGRCPTPSRRFDAAIRGGASFPGVLHLGLGVSVLPLPGGPVLVVAPIVVVPHFLDPTGNYTATVRVPNQLQLKGLDVYLQGLYVDPAAAFGVSATPGLYVPIR